MKRKFYNSCEQFRICIVSQFKANIIEFSLPTIKELSHGEDYSKFAYHVAFLRQFYTLLQDDVESDNYEVESSSALDNSTNRKWKIALANREAKQGITNKSNYATESNISDSNEENDMGHSVSIHNGNAWDIISKKLKKKPRRPSI